MAERTYTDDELRGKDLLIPLAESDLQLADEAEDIRGRHVKDRDGNDIGHVENLYIDEAELKVRFLEVGAGGFLGLGEKRFLIPVDAITSISGDEVHVDRTREHVINAPEYDPTLTSARDRDFWEPYYGYYGYAPFWGAGYAYPRYPYY